MALIKIGENYFNQDDVVYIDCESECYAAHVYLKGMEKPVRVFPVNEDDIKIIGQKWVHNNIEYILQRTYSIFFL